MKITTNELFQCAKSGWCKDMKCPHHEPHVFVPEECLEDSCSRDVMGDVNNIACLLCIKDWDI